MSREELLREKDGIINDAITKGVNGGTIRFAQEFGKYLASTSDEKKTNGCVVKKEKLTTSQVRKFFGEVKRQQMIGYDLSTFVLLKPKLAYAVGRAKGKENKIEDFYEVLSKAIDVVITEEQKGNQEAFKNFIAVFESIVAYHKLAEKG